MATLSFNLLTLKIQLQAGPMRKITVPDYYTYGHLHLSFLVLFGWDDCHLHVFEVPVETKQPEDNGLYRWPQLSNNWAWVSEPEAFLSQDHETKQEERDEAFTELVFGFQQIGDAVQYEYDFGDRWRANIVLENIEKKKVRLSQFIPGIAVVGGSGKTIPEYGRSGGRKYNKQKLNEALSKMMKLVFYSDDAYAAYDHYLKYGVVENEDDNCKARESTVLGKRKNQNVMKKYVSKRQRRKRHIL